MADIGSGRLTRHGVGRDLGELPMNRKKHGQMGEEIIARERRAQIDHLVASVNDEASRDDTMRSGYFARIGGLIAYAKSESDKLIKPQWVSSKITAPEAYNPKDCESPDVAECASPAGALSPENESGSSVIHREILINGMTD